MNVFDAFMAKPIWQHWFFWTSLLKGVVMFGAVYFAYRVIDEKWPDIFKGKRWREQQQQ